MRIACGLVKTSLVLSLFLVSGLSSPALAESTTPNLERVKGTRVSLVKPEGFTKAPSFNGYILKDKVASVMVTEMPAPYSLFSKGFTKEGFAKKKIEILSKEEVDIAGRKGLLLHLMQPLGSMKIEKWVTIFGDEKTSVTVLTTFPQKFASELSDTLKACAMSASWDKALKVDTQENLNFTVQAKEPFKLAKRIQNMLLFSKGGAFPAKSKTDALFLVGESFYRPVTGDKAEFCSNRVKQIRSLSDIEGVDPKPVELDGLEGFEISATANDKQTSEKMYVYQVIVFQKNSYFIHQGISRDSEKEETEPLFKQMSKTFKLTKK